VYRSTGFKSGEHGDHALGSPQPLNQLMVGVVQDILCGKAKYGGTPSCMNHMRSLTTSGGSSSSRLGISVPKEFQYLSPVSICGKTCSPTI
jgi:hypothetical protein